MQAFTQSAYFEHSFWLHILRDHSQFILEAFPDKQSEEIELAKSFFNSFNNFLEKINFSSISEKTNEIEVMVLAFREFKLSLIQKHITDSAFTMHLSPTFLNHMVNELEEYLLILSYLKQNQTPPIFHELHHHLLWLLDASGHAGAISSTLDSTEKIVWKKSDLFRSTFEQFYFKAVELAGYLRTNLSTFPGLRKMNKDVNLEIQLFQIFLKELEELELSNELLGSFSALMADHMFREEMYYLKKLEESASANNH